MNQELRELLENGVTIVTPTLRLARHIREIYNHERMARGDHAWRSVDILDWDNWCLNTRNESLDGAGTEAIVLNQHQEQELWLRVIRDSAAAGRIMQIAGTARQTRVSYQACKAWRIPVFPDDIYLNEDARHFRHWVKVRHRLLQENNWTDRASIPDELTGLIQSGRLRCAQRTVFYGFDQWTPQQRACLDALRDSGADIDILPAVVHSVNGRVELLSDGQEELRQAANWARQRLCENPQARIGVVIPDLEQQRQRVESIFNRVLWPDSLTGAGGRPSPFLISRGQSLADYPLIATALAILQLLQDRLELDQITILLRSPFIVGHPAECGARAILLHKLRDIGEQGFTLKQLLNLLNRRFRDTSSPRLEAGLAAAQAHVEAFRSRLLPGQWIVKFSALLQDLGWPGETALDSDEHQTQQAWKDALDQMLSLDRVCDPMPVTMALNKLAGIIRDTGFQPETEETPIQVLGLEGAAAMGFDHLRVIGCHDQAWPAPVQPLPFIPLALQRQAGIPAATASGQLQRAHQGLQGLLTAASEVVLSVPRQEGDHELRPSPLLIDCGLTITGNALNDNDDIYSPLPGSVELVRFQDDLAPPVGPDENVPGGATILKDQALCPFRAFAHHRLHAGGVSEVDIGLSGLDRGKLVHRAMQLIWDRLHSYKQLKTLTPAVLDDYIYKAVTSAVRQQADLKQETFSERFRELETGRLCGLVRDWLQMDLQRPPFTVAGTEKGHHITFAGLTLSLRLDRIDQLDDGRLVIIDYKTGQANPVDWEGDRPSDPQLPLYAVTAEGDVAALVFAKVKAGDMDYHGYACEDDLIPGKVKIQEDWDGLVSSWRTTLLRLGEAFVRGQAAVDPKDTRACASCDLHTLCRIHEHAEITRSVEEDEPDNR